MYSKFKKFFKGKKNLKFLDVGCGAGGKLIAFQKHGWDVYGVDPDKILINFIKKNINLKTFFQIVLKILNLKKIILILLLFQDH